MRLRQLFREQEQTPEVADVIVFWLEGNETIQHILYNVPVEEIRKPGFEELLRRIVRRNFNKVMIRYQVIGDVTSQGNPDGNTPDTEVPPVLTSKDNEEVPPVEQKPDEVEAPAETTPKEEPAAEEPPTADEIEDAIDAAAEKAGVQNIEVEVIPDSGEPQQVEITPQDETKPPPTINGIEIISPAELNRMLDDYADSVDKDGDGLNDETGEPVTRSSELPPVNVPKLGGGQDGAEGDAGIEGEEGAVTGAQRAEIPSIVEELYRSLNGLGTNETRLLYALKRIESSSHLNAVLQMYRQTYNQSLPQDIIDDLKFQGGNTKKVIEEINKVMTPLGAQLVGSQWFNLRWVKFNPTEWGDVEQLYEYPITEYIAAREKYYQNLTREEEILYPDGGTDMRTDLSDREQAELDRSEAEREELLNKYGRGILRGNISVEVLPGEQA